jgi:hypothetical protein
MNISEISLNSFKEIHNRGYTLDMVYLLSLFKNNIDVRAVSSARITEIVNILVRKGLLTEDDIPTLDGEELLKFINIPGEDIKLVKKKVDDKFDKFWKAFPSTDSYEYKGVKFQGSRALRINKDDCKLKLKSILNEGEHSIDDITKAIEYDVYLKKENSIKTRTNKLSYLQNSLTYLRQRSYEPFLELIKEGKIIKEEEKTFNGTDI